MLVKLNTLFGPPLDHDKEGFVVIKWPNDAGIEISLSAVLNTAYFSITNQSLSKPGVSADELGL